MIDPFLSAGQMLKALRIREISATELLELHLQRVARHDGAINAVVVRDFDRARQAALQADNALSQGNAGPLTGLPMTIKESVNVAGLATCCGIDSARDYVSVEDGTNAARLKQAGAIIFGKTNIPVELSDWQSNNPVYGLSKNPYNLDCTPGGSSGGSAAALAAGLTPLELGSDIGGSIRVPAAFCGVYGHRPSETAIPKSGQFPVPPMPNPMALLSVQGPMARSACDLRLGMDVLGGPDVGEDQAWRLELPEQRHQSLTDFRVAIMAVPDWMPVAPEIRQAQETLIGEMTRLGVQVSDAQPEGFADWRDHYRLYNNLLGAMLGARTPADERARRADLLASIDDPFQEELLRGLQASLADVFGWVSQREVYRAKWRAFFAEQDLLLAPAAMRCAYPHLPLEGSPITASAGLNIEVDGRKMPYYSQTFFPSLSTLAGQPATAFPLGLSTDGLPVGLQAIGPYLNDYTSIGFLQLLESAGVIGFTAPKDFLPTPMELGKNAARSE